MERKEFWLAVINRLRPTIQKAQFITWFQNTALSRVEGTCLFVAVPTSFAQNWLETKYSVKILQAAQELEPKIESVFFEVNGALCNQDNFEGVDVKNIVKKEDGKIVRKVKNFNELSVKKGGLEIVTQALNQKYRLDNFVVAKENRLPHAACLAVANMPGGIYNPLYIYGRVGMGKTHLLQAVGNEILRQYPDKVVKYLTAEKFVSEVVEAIVKKGMTKFKEAYRNVDCLLVDDIQFFAKKDSSQQEFFHTFNELYNANKQIVLTSDRAPAELDGLDDRLTSRFAMGMVVEVLMPDYEARVAILQRLVQQFQMVLDPRVIDFIALNVQNSVRELESVLRQLMAETQLFDRVPTIGTVVEVLKRMNRAQEIIGLENEVKGVKIGARSARDLMDIVAAYYNVTVADLVGGKRQREYALPRQICMYLIKTELGESYEKIGACFGGRNHTTVLHACNKTAEKLKRDMRLVRDVNSLKRELGL